VSMTKSGVPGVLVSRRTATWRMGRSPFFKASEVPSTVSAGRAILHRQHDRGGRLPEGALSVWAVSRGQADLQESAHGRIHYAREQRGLRALYACAAGTSSSLECVERGRRAGSCRCAATVGRQDSLDVHRRFAMSLYLDSGRPVCAKYRSFADGLANGSNRPKATFPSSHEGAENAGKPP
jgi:hypothetical protein